MKKTMLALMATVGLAFGAKAELPTTTGFETGYDLGPLNLANLTQKYEWSAATTNGLEATELACVVTNYAASKPTNLPDAFKEAGAGDNYLAVDTSGAILYRNVNDRTTDTTTEFGEAESIGEGLFFDSDVQFTATDSTGAPEPTTGDKLIVWLSGDDEGNTNLIVTASIGHSLGESLGTANFTNTNPNILVKDNEWHRLTVAAATEGTVTTFKVYVDGDQVTADGVADNKFYSLVAGNYNNYDKLTAVGFQGTGAIDNLVWTTEDPFPVVETTFPMTLTVEGAVNYTDKALYVQDDVLTNEFRSGVAVDVLKETKKITIVIGAVDGYEVTDFTEGDAYVNIDEDPCTYYTKDIAVTSEMLAEGYALTITVTAAGGGEVPTSGEAEPGKSATVKAKDEAAAEAAVSVKVDAAVAEALTAEQKDDFVAAFFNKTVTDNGDGTFTVSVEVDEDAVEKVLDDVIEEALETASDGEITTIPAGLCYKIESGSTVGLGTVAKGVSAGDPLEVEGLSEAAGFYKVTLDVKPIK